MQQQLVRDVAALMANYQRMANLAEARARIHRAAGRRQEANIADLLVSVYRTFVRDLQAGELT